MVELKTYICIVLTNFQRKFQPQFFYKLYSYTEKEKECNRSTLKVRQCIAERTYSENVLLEPYIRCLKLVILFFSDGFLFKITEHCLLATFCQEVPLSPLQVYCRNPFCSHFLEHNVIFSFGPYHN